MRSGFVGAFKRPKTAALAAVAIVAVMATTAWAIGPGVADSGDGVCQAVTASNGTAYTAVLVDPATVAEDVDADQCDIGVYYSPTHTASSITDSHIHGAHQYGVYVDGAGTGPVNIEKSSVFDISPGPVLTGSQQGNGILYRGGTGTVTQTQVYDYQKNGIIATNAASLNTTRNVVRGQGPTNVIAQNGVQYSDGATGNVRDNVIADHYYTPDPIVAAALLIINTNPNSVTRRENDYRNNEVNEYVCPAQNGGCSP